MGKYANEVVKLAKSWIGKNEADGSHKEIIDIYNGHKPLARGYKVKYTDAWCATGVSAVAIKLGYTDIIPTECGCQEMIKKYQNMGCWVENENRVPNAGEVIFYDWQDDGVGDNKGYSDHVGFVLEVVNNIIKVWECNYSNAVKIREIAVNAKTIRGYGVPKYDAEPAAKEPSKPAANTAIKAGQKITLKDTKCYNSETTKESYGKKSGTYYFWDDKVVNGRAKITNKPERVGVKGQVTCWVNVADVTTAATTSKPATPSQPAPTAYYSKYTGSSTQLDKVLEAIGVPEQYRGKWTKRIPVAKANGIANYTGTAAQNIKLMNLAKQGKLKKA